MFTEYIQPTIEIFGVLIDTPVTAATDLLVTAVCYYAFFKLKSYPVNNKVKYYLMIYFLSMGTATALGGLLGHAFQSYFSPLWKLPAWITSMFSIMFLERACIKQAGSYIKPQTATIFGWLNIIELAIFMFLSFFTLFFLDYPYYVSFLFVEGHSAYGLAIVVFSFSIYMYRKTKNPGNKKFIYAVLWAGLAASFFIAKLGVSIWFNHVDFSHIFMSISAWYFYRGSKELIDSVGQGATS